MPFKINVSYKGKTFKIETDSESLIKSKIGDKIDGGSFSPELEGYELEITGLSDSSGFPGIKGNAGSHLRKILLKKGEKGIRDRRKGIRLKKSVCGEEISEKTAQININVIKEGNKKFSELLPKKEEAKEGEGEAEEKKTEAKIEKAVEKKEKPETKNKEEKSKAEK